MLGRMNRKSFALLLATFGPMPAYSDGALLQYELAGELQLEMEQQIFVRSREEAIADRTFSMTFAFGDVDEAGRQSVELTSARASYSAHGMNQRLPASHLAGTSFVLVGTSSLRAEGAEGEIDLGQVTDGGLVPADLLADLLPELPEEPVSLGSSWTSERSIETLEGWSWAGADIVYENEVIDVQESAGSTVVSVRSHGRATLHAAEGRTGFVGEGDLERSVEWSIDAATGRLISYLLEQEASGTSQLPQGDVPVRQLTRVQLLSR